MLYCIVYSRTYNVLETVWDYVGVASTQDSQKPLA